MELEEAVEMAKELEEIDNIIQEGGTFCSAFVMLEEDEEIEEWELGFYSPDNNEITAVKVTSEGPELGVTDEPLHEDAHGIDIGDVNVSGSEALQEAKDLLEKKYSIPYKKILLSLKREDEKQLWGAVFIGGGTKMVSVNIDADNGKIMDSEKRSLLRKGKSYGG